MPDCRFCGIDPALVVHETAECLVFLDYRPVFPGHCLVIPKQHYETLADLPAVRIEPLFREVQWVARAVETALGAAGRLSLSTIRSVKACRTCMCTWCRGGRRMG